MVLAFVGGTLGLILATWGKDLLVALSPGDFPLAQTITIDGRVLPFCGGVSLLAGVALSSRPGAPVPPGAISTSNLRRAAGPTTAFAIGRANLLTIVEIALSASSCSFAPER